MSDTPTPEKAEQITEVNSPQAPQRWNQKRHEAESQSQNTRSRLRIVRYLAYGLIAALCLDIVGYYVAYWYLSPDARGAYGGHVKDILIVFSSLLAFLLGHSMGEKKDDK